MKIAYYGYRDWSFKIFKSIKSKNKILITSNNYDILDSYNPDVIFFVGWSELIPESIINKFKCLCIHPSKLPEYRGGSPIQNQIIDGVEDSAVTLFRMDELIDHGPIYKQLPLNLNGTLEQIFDDIVDKSIKIINEFIHGKLYPKHQDHDKATFCKRRKPEMSEITIDEIKNSTPKQLYDKIRSLQDPYPNSYIKCKNEEKLYLIKSKY
jgi:methionyl-tRNA formyltransferase